MDLIENRGETNTWLKQRFTGEGKRVYALVGSFELSDSPFIVKMQGSRENM